MIKAVFLDRDGVINEHIPGGYATKAEELIIQSGVAASIRRLNDAGIPVVIISNQQGVGKGLMTADQLDSIDSYMRAQLDKLAGARIDRSYYCMHLKTDGCDCRKPKGGQVRRAAKELSIDLASAIFIGDSPTDISAGKDAGVEHSALVLCGGTKTYLPGVWKDDPDSLHRDLQSAVDWIFSQNGED
jgi:D-glycero-D-manno-heptose 1,7-bisphosphate phosphatase